MESIRARVLAYFTIFAMASYIAHAIDPTQLHDFCVGTNDPNNALFVNGIFCKDPKQVALDHFHFKGLNIVGNTNNKQGSNVTKVNAANLPGLNTLGISMARIDFVPYDLNRRHTHPRATKIFTVLEGALYVRFVTSNQPEGSNKLFTKVLYPEDVFVFPQGLIHFQLNVRKTRAVALAALSSQNAGVVAVANAVFGLQLPISVDVLSKAFQLDDKIIKFLQSQFWMDNGR